MKTKEEILRETVIRMTDESLVNKTALYVLDINLAAMQEYADQQSVAFCEWYRTALVKFTAKKSTLELLNYWKEAQGE